jgi:hypothetical protein
MAVKRGTSDKKNQQALVAYLAEPQFHRPRHLNGF